LLLFARPVGAQTPLPSSPFGSGGFVPPDAATARIEDRLATYLLLHDATAKMSCAGNLETARFRADQSGDSDAAAAADARFNECYLEAYRAWLEYRDALLAGGALPACLATAFDLDVVHGAVESATFLTTATLFCDGTPAGGSRIHVPSDPAVQQLERAVARIVLGQATREARCALAYARALARAGGRQESIDRAKARFDRCYVTSTFAAQQKIHRIYATASGPPCLPEQSARGYLNEHIAAPGGLVGDVYCAQ
jgi:hypothetical protein